MVIAALKSDNEKTGGLKTKGKARLASMLKSGKPLEIFTVKESDLKKFAQGAKQYGIVYCALRGKDQNKDGVCDVMVKAEDAPKISRLVERFKFAALDKAKIESGIIAEAAEKEQPKNPTKAEPAKARPSEPISGSKSKSARGTSDKPSVKGELREIAAAKKEKDAEAPKKGEEIISTKKKGYPAPTHKQPPQGGRGRPKKPKAR
jgi:hypothetical protein